MALALLASRNESYFGEQKVYARRNPNPKLCPNPNPNPSFNGQIGGDGGHEPDRCPRDELGPMDLDEPSPTSAAAASDGSSFDRNPADLGHRRDPGGGCVTFNISSYSRKERRELKRRLEAELEQVRSVSSWIESREIQSRFAHGGGREVNSSAVLLPIPGSDALIGRSAPPKLQTNEIKKRLPAASPELRKLHTGIMKKCGQILTRLMKHKGGGWFNLPVDTEGMGLHDYHLVIKNPMDLGTVKSKLGNGFYPGPLEFASDIRLTFNNALTYNPKGHLVNNLADQLLKQFETSFSAAYAKYERDRSAIQRREEEQRQRAALLARVATAPTPAPTISLPKPLPVQSQQQQQPSGRSVKQSSPKVNEPSLRGMSLEEKRRLGYAIQSLPDVKMAQVLNILSDRKNVTSSNGDVVEIDVEAMDNETLWELDRFLADWKETLSNMKKRQPETAPPLSLPFDAGNKSLSVVGEAPEAMVAKKSKKGDPVDEDVDIGDEMPVTHYPSVEIEKESSSGSESSSSSGNNCGDNANAAVPVVCVSKLTLVNNNNNNPMIADSDSGSSSSDSDDDTDDDDAQSLAPGPRRSPRS